MPLNASSPLVIAVIAGVAIGWLLASIRMKGTMRLSATPSVPGISPQRTVAKTRTMELRCKCGSIMKFRDPVEDGYHPFPSGDSVACSSCGKVIDLEQFRKLQSAGRA